MAASNRLGPNASSSGPAPSLVSAPHSEPGVKNTPEDDVANTATPNLVVTIKAADSIALQQRPADLEAAAQRNSRRRRQSDSDSDNGRAPKRTNLKGRAPDVYWGENHQKLHTFIRQCELNFRIDGCTRDKTRIAYAGFYCRGTPETQWAEYKQRPEHREPHVITWDDMKKELRRQLGEGQVYFDEMYGNWQTATQRSGQTVREFAAYLRSIRSVLLDLDEAGAPNETLLMHRMRQGLRSEIRAALYRNPNVPKDWPTFLEAAIRAESCIRLERRSISQAGKSSYHNLNSAGREIYRGRQRS